MLVGCKVTLRKEGCDDFINTLSFTFPRIEKRVPATGFISSFVTKYRAGMNSSPSARPFAKAYSSFRMTLGELILFYPIELGLGLHPDVRQVVINFKFSSTSIEELYFFLRQSKVPVSHLLWRFFIILCACSSIG